jgi:hypothetical protein
MNSTGDRHSRADMPLRPTDTELAGFYIHGFHRALLRYRTFVIIGWAITALGAVGIFGSCHGIDRGDLLGLAIPVITMAAGVVAVHLSITALDSYITTPFPLPDEGEVDEAVRQKIAACRQLMNDVEEGGWKEAFEAIAKVEAMLVKDQP